MIASPNIYTSFQSVSIPHATLQLQGKLALETECDGEGVVDLSSTRVWVCVCVLQYIEDDWKGLIRSKSSWKTNCLHSNELIVQLSLITTQQLSFWLPHFKLVAQVVVNIRVPYE